MSPEPSFTGLDAAEAARRLEEDGPNLLTADRTRPLWRIVAGALREPMFLLLAAATALYLGLGDLAEGLLLGAAGLVTIALVVAQEARSEAALRALRRMADPVVRVVREGRTLTVPAREIVRGDLVLVAEGQRPSVLFIGCADSRVVPDLLTSSAPGDLFVVRNMGNFVPPFEPDRGYHGTSASIELATLNLGVGDIVVCGHSQCGGIRAAQNRFRY